MSTGTDVVGGDDHESIPADLVGMETFAVVRACRRFGLPILGLRGVSDGNGWTELLGLLDKRLAQAIARIPMLPRPP